MAPSRARARYQADLAAAVEANIPNIFNIRRGESEDEVAFTFKHPRISSSSQVEIFAAPQDLPGYPHENYFLVYTNENTSELISKEFETALTDTMGMRVGDMISHLSRRLRTVLDCGSGRSEDAAMTDNDTSEGDDDVDFDIDDDLDFGLMADTHGVDSLGTTKQIAPSVLQRLRRDFRAVRSAGFKVGKICGLDQHTDYSIASTSVRIDKLGLSEETLLAWNVLPSDYVVLLIRYTGTYPTFEDIIERPVEQAGLSFRLRKCSEYRPTMAQAIGAFDDPKLRPSHKAHGIPTSAGGALSLLGTGESIDMLLNTSFIGMMKLRKEKRVSWDLAKKIQADFIMSMPSGSWSSGQEANSLAKVQSTATQEPDLVTKLPPILSTEHLSDSGEMALPLIATQFALRYYVKCTEYCMICHQKVDGNFEALKPYVCGNALCLFQYMSLGFGPSIDQEIVKHPYVVDLLISFCYASLCQKDVTDKYRIREFPTGLALNVPNIRLRQHDLIPKQSAPPSIKLPLDDTEIISTTEIVFDWYNSTVTPKDEAVFDPGWKVGQWILLYTPSNPKHCDAPDTLHHARIEWSSPRKMCLCILARVVVPISSPPTSPRRPTFAAGSIAGHIVPYDQNIDDLSDDDKAIAMKILLCSLPPVMEMRSYLKADNSRKLSTWERIDPAAMGVLRWIIASNRSYILQVSEWPSSDNDEPDNDTLGRKHEKIGGVKGWFQFRFAQGSPEKEARFQEVLKSVNKAQRTLVAWHGSPYANWHSIIRQGLDYSQTANGRSYGHGVYFSRQFDYSLHYSNYRTDIQSNIVWPHSLLKVDTVMSLNELVNLPDQFAYYNKLKDGTMVVQHTHWIQCRYLFIRSSLPEIQEQLETLESARPHGEIFIQDAILKATGPRGSNLSIPRTVIPSADDGAIPIWRPSRKEPGSSSSFSDVENDEDVNFLFSDRDDDDDDDEKVPPKSGEPSLWNLFGLVNRKPQVAPESPPTPTYQESQTDFRPGTLDFDSLPLLAPPSYANESAQKTIAKELKKTQKTLSTTPLHELGWYIDFEKVTNMFQLIVELHSFDPDLPLAKDMKKAGLTSIVLEVRFLRNFPLSPPFVRVIRPRFLQFTYGGGGHVTAGGAMCMELLTNTGWSPVYSLENVLLQVRLAMCSLEPSPARLDTRSRGPSYGITEAVDAYRRAAQAHGWQVPADLTEAMSQAPDS